MKRLALFLLLVVPVVSLAQNATTARAEPKEFSSQYQAQMTKSQALEIENLTLKITNAYLAIQSQAKAEFDKQTSAFQAQRAALLHQVAAQNPGLAWDEQSGTFKTPGLRPNPSKNVIPDAPLRRADPSVSGVGAGPTPVSASNPNATESPKK